MLPLRISISGFMSYRDATVFDFEGARLWMLAGDNGAGKSSVFDALRWVLFGVHRAGKQKPELLIHHESKKLSVEVELQLGSEVFKLKRTLGRDTSRPTWDIARRVDNAWEGVAGTSMMNGYNAWIADNIGLTDEAFCASVYLSQNRADAILNADADARYELLSQLVDLEQYERWHERALERRGAARLEMNEAQNRWKLAPAPQPEHVELLRERGANLEIEVNELDNRARELDGARADASRWEEWIAKLQGLQTREEEQRVLLGDEAQIERDFARLEQLNLHRAAVDALCEALKKRDELQQKLDELEPQQELAQAALTGAGERENAAAVALETAQNAEKSARETWSECVSEVARLEKPRVSIERRALLMSKRAEQLSKNAEFESDLDERLKRCQVELDQAREAARVLPLWRRFEAARRALSTAKSEISNWTTRGNEAAGRANELQTQLLTARAHLQNADDILRRAEKERARIKERERALNERRADFAQVEGEGTCHFCGQELSAQHRAAELTRLEEAARELEREKTESQSSFDVAKRTFEDAQNAEKLEVRSLADAERDVTHAKSELRHGSEASARELDAARNAWDESGNTAHIEGFDEVFETALNETARPDASDFERWSALSSRLGELEKQVAAWQKRTHKRDTGRVELARLEEELAPLQNEWDDERVEQWRERAQQLETELEQAKTRFDASQSALETARKLQSEAAKSERAARAALDKIARQIGPLEGLLCAASNALETATPAFQRVFDRVGALPEREHVERERDEWARETSDLERSKVAARHADLIEARDNLSSIERDTRFYKTQIESLSPLARGPRSDVERAWNETKMLLFGAQQERETLGDTLRRLEREAREHAVLEASLGQKSRDFGRWEELARLLGPHELQRHLLRGAESAIVREANRVLETISGGTLRLELVPDSDESSGNRRPKVLDVVCHSNTSEAAQAILPAFLSGSQRFRVAVALALGIGRTAARGSGNGRAARVETILIDEGFGGLDKTGRDEMKDELRELGRELGRVILVSHQEDFAGAFPNRFNISLEAGVSRVVKVVE